MKLNRKYWKRFYKNEWIEIFSYEDLDLIFCHYYKTLNEYHITTQEKNFLTIIVNDSTK
jgi:hypothetical protein